MMRVVIVNHMPPTVQHVSGMRAWYFARELAARGHQVVLICEWREGAPAPPDAVGFGQQIAGHDWSRPLVIAVRPTASALLDRVRAKGTAAVVRKGLVVWSYVRHGGMFTDFSRAAEPYLAQLAQSFQPEVVWGIFGNTDCWLIAQRLSRLSGCGWVGDMKDGWDVWVPEGLRALVARRFQDMSAGTANAGFHAGVFGRWFGGKPEAIYSGVDRGWIRPSSTPSAPGGDFRVMVVGGTYGRQNLERFVCASSDWVQQLTDAERERVTFSYAGSDAAMVESAASDLASRVRLEVRGYLPLSELADLCQGAAVNVYLWSPSTFHHKLVELLCCRRPVICFPGERAESIELARRVGGSLNVCVDERQLQDTLNAVWSGGLQPSGGPERLQFLTWSAQADHLEALLRQVVNEGPVCAR